LAIDGEMVVVVQSTLRLPIETAAVRFAALLAKQKQRDENAGRNDAS